ATTRVCLAKSPLSDSSSPLTAIARLDWRSSRVTTTRVTRNWGSVTLIARCDAGDDGGDGLVMFQFAVPSARRRSFTTGWSKDNSRNTIGWARPREPDTLRPPQH